MTHPNSTWTDDQIATLEQMHAKGESYAVIGAAIGKTRLAVAGKIDRLGLPKKAQPTRTLRIPRPGCRRPQAPGPCLLGCCSGADLMADERDLEICTQITKGEALTTISQTFPEVGVLHIHDLKQALEAAA